MLSINRIRFFLYIENNIKKKIQQSIQNKNNENEVTKKTSMSLSIRNVNAKFIYILLQKQQLINICNNNNNDPCLIIFRIFIYLSI